MSNISKLSPFELRDYLRHAARTRGVWSAAREAYLDGVLGNIGEIQMNEAITFGMGGVFCAMVAFWLGMSHAQSNMAEECRLVGATRIDGVVFMCSKAQRSD